LFESEEQLKSGHCIGGTFDRADFPAFLFTFEIQVQSASSARIEKNLLVILIDLKKKEYRKKIS